MCRNVISTNSCRSSKSILINNTPLSWGFVWFFQVGPLYRIVFRKKQQHFIDHRKTQMVIMDNPEAIIVINSAQLTVFDQIIWSMQKSLCVWCLSAYFITLMIIYIAFNHKKMHYETSMSKKWHIGEWLWALSVERWVPDTGSKLQAAEKNV